MTQLLKKNIYVYDEFSQKFEFQTLIKNNNDHTDFRCLSITLRTTYKES